MKRILPIVFVLLILLAAAVLIGPSFVDWNKYKPQIIEQAKSAAGYDVAIDGDIGLSVLPLPQLKIEGLKVAAPRGGQPNLLTMKEAKVSVNLLPLISGEISIDTVRLVNPDIQLEKMADGGNSWMSDKLLTDQNDAARSDNPAAQPDREEQKIMLNKLVIEDGRVSYLDRATGKEHVAEMINLDVKADSLSGPFKADGKLTYGGEVIELDARTERLGGAKKEMPVDLEIGLPESNASAAFKGVIATDPMELQGKMEIRTDNLASLLALAGGEGSPALARKLSFSGLVTANEQRLSSQEIDIAFGEAKGKGNVAVTNLKNQNPVMVTADMAFQGVLNLDQLVPARDKSKEPSIEEKVAKGQRLSPDTGLIPETLSLPVPVDGTLKITADGIQTGGKVFKGIVLNASKTGGAIDVAFKALDMPGKTRVEGQGDIDFTSSSKSGEKGITYADPNVTFTVAGSSGQLPTLLRAFAPAQDGNAALEIYKTAQFNLSGTVSPSTVRVADSTVKLDQTTVGLAASYAPNGGGGRPDIMVDLTTDTVDIDAIIARLSGQKKQAVQENAAGKTDVKKALEPVRAFEMPVNLTF
ncbi:MAG TPA: AsmA family protein, partial [Micavibrio sp.]|nr:AsmA family protein [Micavibrio sp.]